MEQATCVEVCVDGKIYVLAVITEQLRRRASGDLITTEILSVVPAGDPRARDT